MQRLAIGEELPSISEPMKNVDSSLLSLPSLVGSKGTLVIFTCNHCPYAEAWESRIALIGNEFQKLGIGVVAINSNDPKKYPIDGFEGMQERAQKLDLKFPYVVDSTSNVARAFGAKKTPEIFLFDKEQRLIYHGAVDDNLKAQSVKKHYLRSALTSLLDDKPTTENETKSVGCSIKYRN